MEIKNPLYKNIGAHVINTVFTIDKLKEQMNLLKIIGLYQVEQCTIMNLLKKPPKEN